MSTKHPALIATYWSTINSANHAALRATIGSTNKATVSRPHYAAYRAALHSTQ